MYLSTIHIIRFVTPNWFIFWSWIAVILVHNYMIHPYRKSKSSNVSMCFYGMPPLSSWCLKTSRDISTLISTTYYETTMPWDMKDLSYFPGHCSRIIILNGLNCFIIFKPILSVVIKNECQRLPNCRHLCWIEKTNENALSLSSVCPHSSPHTYSQLLFLEANLKGSTELTSSVCVLSTHWQSKAR